MREVRAPDGFVWECFIEWEGRKPLRRSFRHLREHREARARREASNSAFDVAGGCADLGMISDTFAAIALLIGVIALLVVAGPWIGFVLFGIVELGIVLVLIAGGFVGRALLRRPWRVVAVNEAGDLWAWRQVGWFASRELVRQLADQLEDGRAPADILPSSLEDGSPYRIDPDAPLGLLAHPWARIGAVGFMAASLVAAIVILGT